ncbi:MAG: immune inhibitor A [Candidatus Promineifilaceae bacterium]|nr:immune inhibitor A [Candidatus Promineifilaceae bacterium]
MTESETTELATPLFQSGPPSLTAAPLATLPNENNSIVPSLTVTPITHLTQVPPATVAPTLEIALDVPSFVNQEAIPNRAFDDLENLYETDYPVYDYFNVFLRFVRPDERVSKNIGPRSFQRQAFEIDDRQVFRTNEGTIEATLVEVTEHIYFWVDDNLEYNKSDFIAIGQQLESEQYYGQFAHLFGTPWIPGMDGDPHFSIVHLATSNNEYELGYFSDLDEYPNTLPLFSDSNQQEVIYLNMDQLELGSELYYGTLIHELQHLAQWNLDKNESLWMNEGLSQLAELYVGLDTALPDAYMEQTDVRLDRWAYEDDVIDAHYANSFMFLVYFWEQLGEAGIFELIRQPANGLSSVRKVLQGISPERDLDQFLADWAAANYLDDPTAGHQYSYTRLDPPAPALQSQDTVPPFDLVEEIDPLAVHYLALNSSEPVNIEFAGDTTAKIIDSPPTSGDQMWYALPGNDTHAQLSKVFDLRQVSQATLEFNTWFELESDYDFAYVTVSADQGATWTVLTPQHSAEGDYGPALSGNSAGLSDSDNGWIRERISLNNFVGQEIIISFQVLTDFVANGQGFAIDDIAIPEIDYVDDVESLSSEWQASGFAKTGWLLPQVWSFQIIRQDQIPQVAPLQLDELNQYQGTVTLGPEGGTLVIMPLTSFTNDQARYWLRVTR